jgi:hypothetical protein
MNSKSKIDMEPVSFSMQSSLYCKVNALVRQGDTTAERRRDKKGCHDNSHPAGSPSRAGAAAALPSCRLQASPAASGWPLVRDDDMLSRFLLAGL